MDNKRKAKLIAAQFHYRRFWSEDEGMYVINCLEWPRFFWKSFSANNGLRHLFNEVAREIRYRLDYGLAIL